MADSWLKKRAQEAAQSVMSCTCIDAYKDRGLTAPDCAFCNYGEDVAEATEVVAREMTTRALRALFSIKESGAGYEVLTAWRRHEESAEKFRDEWVKRAIAAAEREEP